MQHKAKNLYAGRGGKYPSITTTALDPVQTGGLVEEVMAIVTYPCPTKLSQIHM
jgi:hypothetical protein